MKKGFTLIEMAVVLMIIGLIVGGIMTGSNMIRNAELQTIVTDLEKYKTAVDTFQTKYESLPGDMPDAIDYWGAAHTTPTACDTTVSNGKATCNGNGDGRIASHGTSHEAFRFWQHLANAELIKGNFSGVSGSGTNNWTSVTGNSPGTEIDTSIWFVWDWSTWPSAVAGTANLFANPYINLLALGGVTTNSWGAASIFTPKEVWSIDKKIDDGKPGTGAMIAFRWETCTNAANAQDLNSDYAIAEKNLACAIIFPNVW